MINSILTLHNSFNSTQDILKWINERNDQVEVEINRIPFSEMKLWSVDNDGALHHQSGKFFSIEGVHIETNLGPIPSWDQPIIHQPEIGLLGIIVKFINGVPHCLMQAKIEPGNVNCVQISPTLQATKSNYSHVHKGKTPKYLEYFLKATPNQVILDQLQSEQGARFLKKRNRNIIIQVDEDLDLDEDFKWMTIAQIKELMHIDNMVNMDTRTVLSGIDFSSYLYNDFDLTQFSSVGREMLYSAKQRTGLHTTIGLLSWLTNLKTKYELSIVSKPINLLRDWVAKSDEIIRYDERFFKVIGVNVKIANREVKSWCQPLVQPMHLGLCAFIIKKINGIYHFLVQAKFECGNYDVIELAPTVHTLIEDNSNKQLHAYYNFVLSDSPKKILLDTLQSEEGGRFYHEENRNMIIEADDDFPIETDEFYRWMTLGQINDFLRFNNYLNIQARSLLAAIKYI